MTLHDVWNWLINTDVRIVFSWIFGVPLALYIIVSIADYFEGKAFKKRLEEDYKKLMKPK